MTTKQPTKTQTAYIRREAGVEYDTSARLTQRTLLSCLAAGWIERPTGLTYRVTDEGIKAAKIDPSQIVKDES